MRGASGKHDTLLGSLTVSLIDEPPCTLIGIPRKSKVLTHKAVAFASDFVTSPLKSTLYPLLFICEAFDPKVHVLYVNKDSSITEEMLEEKFGDLFPYNLKAFAILKGDKVVPALNTYADEHDIDLLTLLHHTSKNLRKRSITKQYSFIGKTPLLVTSVQ